MVTNFNAGSVLDKNAFRIQVRTIVRSVAAWASWGGRVAFCMGVSMAMLNASFAQAVKDKEAVSLTLQADATTQVRQDTVNLVMAKTVEGADPQALHNQLTRAIEPAFKQAKSQQALTVKTGAFRVSPVFGADGKMSGWRGRAELLIESQDFQAATKIVNTLSDQLVLSGIRFYLSDELRKKQEAALIRQAAQAFRERASLAAQAFGFQDYRIEKLDLGASAAVGFPQPVMLRSSPGSPAPKSDVVLAADSVPVTVQVSGTVVLY